MKKYSDINEDSINETEMAFSDVDFSKINIYGENPDLEYLS